MGAKLVNCIFHTRLELQKLFKTRPKRALDAEGKPYFKYLEYFNYLEFFKDLEFFNYLKYFNYLEYFKYLEYFNY